MSIKKKKPSLMWHTMRRVFLPLFILQLATLLITGWLILLPFMQQAAAELSNNMAQSVLMWQKLQINQASSSSYQTWVDKIQQRWHLTLVQRPEHDKQPSFLPYIRLVKHTLAREHNLVASSYYTNQPDQGLYWMYFPEEQIALGFQRNQFNTQPVLTLLLLFVMTLILALLTTWFLANQQRKQLLALTTGAAHIRQGDFSLRIPEGNTKETIALGRAFNQMADHLTTLLEKRAILLAGISHDVRTPLTRIKLLLAIQQAEIPHDLQIRLQNELDEISELLDLFLNASHAAYTQMGQLEPHNIYGLLDDLTSQHPMAERLRFIAVEPMTQLVSLNPLAFRRILNNLVDNALKYTDGLVNIRCSQQPQHTMIRVRDYGQGLSDTQLRDISKPFVNAHATRSVGVSSSTQINKRTDQHLHKSIGLGLSIVHYLCQSQGWSVDMTNCTASQDDHVNQSTGLCITITIPHYV
ncbi:MAG: ATP-binding protein [bacterium]